MADRIVLDEQRLQDSYVVFKKLASNDIIEALQRAGAVMAKSKEDNGSIAMVSDQCKKFQDMYNGAFLKYVTDTLSSFDQFTNAAEAFAKATRINEIKAQEVDYQAKNIDLSGIC